MSASPDLISGCGWDHNTRVEQSSNFHKNPVSLHNKCGECCPAVPEHSVIFRGSAKADSSVRGRNLRICWAVWHFLSYRDRSREGSRVRGTPGVPGKILVGETVHSQACCSSNHLCCQLGNSNRKTDSCSPTHSDTRCFLCAVSEHGLRGEFEHWLTFKNASLSPAALLAHPGGVPEPHWLLWICGRVHVLIQSCAEPTAALG